MRESANFCENRLISYLTTDNAALGTKLRNQPMFGTRSVKTGGFMSKTIQASVKTASALYNLALIHRGNLRQIATAYLGWQRGTVHIYSLDGEIVR